MKSANDTNRRLGKRGRLFILLTIGIAVGGAIYIFCFLPPDNSELYEQLRCYDNIRQLAADSKIYCRADGDFRYAHFSDKTGRPTLSWRVATLPAVGHADLCKQLRFGEPWDSPHNRAVTSRVDASWPFHCPSIDHSREQSLRDETDYVMVVGLHTIFDGRTGTRFEDVTDGLENTIMIVETKNLHIHWAEPRDLKFDEMSFRINDPDRPSISSHHPGGAHVVFCDERVRFLKDDTDPEIVRALLTIAGGEDVSEFLKTLDKEAYSVGCISSVQAHRLRPAAIGRAVAVHPPGPTRGTFLCGSHINDSRNLTPWRQVA